MRILLADDHDVVRHGLRALVEARPGWTVVGEARNGAEAVELASRLRPDVAILDIAMPELSGLEATRRIRRGSPRTEVLVFTLHEGEQMVREALAAGAKGYLLKSDAAQSVVAAVEAVAAQRPYFNWRVSETILGGFLRTTAGEPGAAAGQLTVREAEIVRLLAGGCTNREIGRRLGISVKTVETHRAAVMRKIGGHSVADVVRYAVQRGMAGRME